MKTAAELMAQIKRDTITAIEVRETYEARIVQLRREGKFLTARRLKRSSLAELLNPDNAEPPACSICGRVRSCLRVP